jgi:hypothetical protein
MARLALAEAELAVIAEAIREAIAAELLAPGSSRTSCLTASTPAARRDRPPPGRPDDRAAARRRRDPATPARAQERDGHAALTNEQIAADLDWKPAGTSLRALLDDLRRVHDPLARR